MTMKQTKKEGSTAKFLIKLSSFFLFNEGLDVAIHIAVIKP